MMHEIEPETEIEQEIRKRFFNPFRVKNRYNMINAIYINVNDVNDKFTEKYKPKIKRVISYLEDYSRIMQQNGKPYLNEQQIKQRVEDFFEDENNWNLVEKEDILEKILSPQQFQQLKDPNIIDFDAPDGGSRKRRKTRKTRKSRK